MLRAMALARWVGVTTQSAFPCPNWSQTLRSHTSSRTDAAGGGGETGGAPPTGARASPRARVSRGSLPVTNPIRSPLRTSPASSSVTARGRRDAGALGRERQATAHSTAPLPGDERAFPGNSAGVRWRCDAQETAAVGTEGREVLREALVEGRPSARDVDAQDPETGWVLRRVGRLLVPDRGEQRRPVGRPLDVGHEVRPRCGVDDGVRTGPAVADPQAVHDDVALDLDGEGVGHG